MARIVLESYLVQFPMGGYLSWVLQFLVGLKDLGHDVYFMERSVSPCSCFDPATGIMGDDASAGAQIVNCLFARFGFEDRWSFVDVHGRHFGLSESRVAELMKSIEVFIDMGARWASPGLEATRGIRVLIDGEPSATQIKMELVLAGGQTLPSYDFYYTVGANVADRTADVPSAGRPWRHLFYPIVGRLFAPTVSAEDAPFTTVMSWQAHESAAWNGVTYGAKDMEFPKFMDLPARVACPMEIALGGRNPPIASLEQAGWRIRNSHATTTSFDAFLEYINHSRGEFTVCKNVFVATHSGWFGDRAAAYLASGRPVVMQDTGFSRHLPCGKGLFAVTTVSEAAEAINEINGNYQLHSEAARDIALSYLDASIVLPRFLSAIGA